MSVRPSQGDADKPEVIEFGIAAFDAHLDDAELTFPAGREELIRRLDDPEIPVDAHGNSVSLSTALGELSKQEFGSEQELLNALHPVFESYRDRTSTGVLASIRALLPF